MSKYVILALLVLAFVCSLQSVDAKGAKQGFCFGKIHKKTGGCKKLIKKRVQKVDCCASGGVGWSSKKRNKDNCEPCSTSVPVLSRWSGWGPWSICNATCGPSFQVSNRTCISNGPKTCRGRSQKTRPCNTPPCPIDGGWSPWGNWSRCSKTCGAGYQTQARTCTNPPPQFGGKDCQGNLEQARQCEDQKHCPIHGGLGQWGDWSACDKDCGIGRRIRERPCDNPKPQFGGRPCNDTGRTEFKYCRKEREENCKRTDSSGSGSASGEESGSGSAESGFSSGSASGEWTRDSFKDDEDLSQRRLRRKRSIEKLK